MRFSDSLLLYIILILSNVSSLLLAEDTEQVTYEEDYLSFDNVERYFTPIEAPGTTGRGLPSIKNIQQNIMNNIRKKNQNFNTVTNTLRHRRRKRTQVVKSKIKNMISSAGGGRIRSNMKHKDDNELFLILLLIYALFVSYFGNPVTNSPTLFPTFAATPT